MARLSRDGVPNCYPARQKMKAGGRSFRARCCLLGFCLVSSPWTSIQIIIIIRTIIYYYRLLLYLWPELIGSVIHIQAGCFFWFIIIWYVEANRHTASSSQRLFLRLPGGHLLYLHRRKTPQMSSPIRQPATLIVLVNTYMHCKPWNILTQTHCCRGLGCD